MGSILIAVFVWVLALGLVMMEGKLSKQEQVSEKLSDENRFLKDRIVSLESYILQLENRVKKAEGGVYVAIDN